MWCSVAPGEPGLHSGRYSAVSVRTLGRLQLCQNPRTMELRSPWATGERKAKAVEPLYTFWLCRKLLCSQKPNKCKLVIQVGSRRCWNIRGYPWNITLWGFAAEVLPRPLPCASGEMLQVRLILGQWLTTFVDGGREKVIRTHWFWTLWPWEWKRWLFNGNILGIEVQRLEIWVDEKRESPRIWVVRTEEGNGPSNWYHHWGI